MSLAKIPTHGSSNGGSSGSHPGDFVAGQSMECLRLVSQLCDNTNNSSALAAGFQLVTWLVPNYICSAVCICFTGFFLAPIFPCAIVMITELIPPELHVGVIGLFGTIGGAGAAATPFVLGALSDKVGRPVDTRTLMTVWLLGHGPLHVCGVGSLDRPVDFRPPP
jgi:MFS family permease